MNEKKKEPFFHVVKRDALPWYQSVGIRAVAIVLALILCAIITTVTTGINPIQVYQSIFAGAFGSARKTWITFQNISILLLISLALTPAFKMKFWNIGGAHRWSGICSLHDLSGEQASECGSHPLHDCGKYRSWCVLGIYSGIFQGKMEYK